LEIAHPVDGVEFDTDQAKVSLLRVPDRPGVAAQLFGEVAQQDLDVDLIIQSIHEGNTNDIAFTVTRHSLDRAEAVAAAILPTLGGQMESEFMIDRQIAKISVAGAGMIGRPGVAAQMFSTLAEAGINIQMISTSEVKVSCVIDAADGDRAIGVLCQGFDISHSVVSRQRLASDAAQVSPVRGVALDLSQAQIAIRHVPDRPGMAAKLFQRLAHLNISVDMIIQSQRCRVVDGMATRDIAFTVVRGDVEEARQTLAAAALELGFGDVVVDSSIAKVSIVGIGMVGRPGVAAQMFRALSQADINIQMIATSEIKVSCVVPEAQGIAALRAIHHAFGLAGQQKIQVPG